MPGESPSMAFVNNLLELMIFVQLYKFKSDIYNHTFILCITYQDVIIHRGIEGTLLKGRPFCQELYDCTITTHLEWDL